VTLITSVDAALDAEIADTVDGRGISGKVELGSGIPVSGVAAGSP